MKLRVYEEYVKFFSLFVDHRITHSNSQNDEHHKSFREICQIFSSSCQVLISLAKLLAKSQISIYSMEGEEDMGGGRGGVCARKACGLE